MMQNLDWNRDIEIFFSNLIISCLHSTGEETASRLGGTSSPLTTQAVAKLDADELEFRNLRWRKRFFRKINSFYI